MAEPSKRKPGRPAIYTEALGLEICRRLSEGESLLRICKDPAMPSRPTVHLWVLNDPAFSASYARARELQADRMLDECEAIADDATYDWAERQSRGEASVLADYEHIQRSRLRVDTRKWIAARMAPWKYGDRVAVDQHVTGSVAHEHKHEHTLAADAEALSEVLGILNALRGNGANGHDKEPEEPTLQ